MTILIFILAVVWGSLSAQFFLQMIISFIISLFYLTAVPFSKVSKMMNLLGAGTSLFQVALNGALFVGGNWFSAKYIDYGSWNAATIASVVSFVVTIFYIVPQISGKFLLARMCAWRPVFLETSNAKPSRERVAFARRVRASEQPKT